MKPLFYESSCEPMLNARIMRVIEETVCRYRNSLPNGWRVIIKFHRDGKVNPYYHLDLQSNQGGGDYAPVKMKMLEQFPGYAATGSATPAEICGDIEHLFNTGVIQNEIAIRPMNILRTASRVTDLPEKDWEALSGVGITHWYGGIRIPYDILVTDYAKKQDGEPLQQDITRTTGEIRIAFSGAKEWQDVYFALKIFHGIQVIMNELWDTDQIWFNLRELGTDPVAGFWLTNMELEEAPLVW